MAKNQPSTQKSRQSQILNDPQSMASAILSVGAAAWKGLSVWSNVDFLLSIREERFAIMFQFFDTTGWWLLLIFGLAWLAVRWVRGPTQERVPSWAVVIAASVMMFLFGVLIAVKSSGEIPSVFVGWGGVPGRCSAIIDTSRLLSFRDTYKLALVCGIQDPATDILEDNRITISNSFNIVPGGLSILATHELQPVDLSPNQPHALWHHVILIPNGVSTGQGHEII
jgi:hypothetical protein